MGIRQWWLDADERYAAYGIFGQDRVIDPKARLVIAGRIATASSASASLYDQQLEAALAAISEHLRSQ